LNQVATPEYTFSLDIDAPLSPWFPRIWGVLRGFACQIEGRFLLMEVPIQRCPQHHGYLACRAGWRLEVIAGWIGYGTFISLKSQAQWRLPLGIQMVPAVVLGTFENIMF